MKILLIGDSGIDTFIYGKVRRISPEAPVPILIPERTINSKGMAGNLYDNFIGLGCELSFLTNNKKPIKIRYVDDVSNYMLLRVDEFDKIEKELELTQPEFNELLENIDGFVISDYNKGYLNEEKIQILCDEANKRGIPTFIDTKKKIGSWAYGFDFIKINHKEYLENEGNFNDYKKQLIVTLGDQGAIHYDYSIKSIRKYPLEHKVDVRDLSGAGDTFFAAFVVEYIKTKNIKSAIEFANKCASIVVTYKGVVSINNQKINAKNR